MVILRLVALGLLLGAVVPAAVAASDLEAHAVLSGLQRWLDETRDLEGRFSQTLISGAMGAGEEESGTLWVARPGRMRWDYNVPEVKIAIVADDRTWLYIADEQQLLLGRLEGEGELLLELLAGAGRLEELFDAALLATPERGGDGAYRLLLTPRDDSEVFERVTLSVRPPRFDLAAAEVLDGAGNRMAYTFTKLRRNRGVPDGTFRFEAPEGTDVSGSHEVPTP